MSAGPGECPWTKAYQLGYSTIVLTRAFCARRYPVMTAGRIIRWSTALAVLGVAAVAAAASYQHAYDLVWAHGESGWDGSTWSRSR